MLSHLFPVRATGCSRLALWFALLLTPGSSWAGYKSPKVQVNPAGSYASHQTQGSITIAADPYQTWDRIKTAFDAKDLEKLRIVPINIIISNDGEDLISLDGDLINLIEGNNRTLSTLPVDDVVRALLTRGGRISKTPAPSPIPIPGRKGGGRGDAFELEADFNNKSLKTLRIPARTTASGFIFFRPPEGRKRVSGYKVYVPEIKNLKTKQNLLFFEIELK